MYDGLGRRVEKVLSRTTTKFVHDGWNVVQEKDAQCQVSANLLTGVRLDDVFVRTDAAQWAFLSDALGSTVALADTAGAVQTAYTYEPFGGTTVSGASSSNSYQFTGRENDSTGTLGLYNLRARFYSPALGRFLTQDPIGFAGGDENVFVYAMNQPTVMTDVFGLQGDDESKSYAQQMCEIFSFDPESCGPGDPPGPAPGDFAVNLITTGFAAWWTYQGIRSSDRLERWVNAGLVGLSLFTQTCYNNRRFHTGIYSEALLGRGSTILDKIPGCAYRPGEPAGSPQDEYALAA